MRTWLWILVGALIMFVLLKIAAKTTGTESGMSTRLRDLLRTQQVANLVRTNEFRELVKTNEFKRFASTLASEQLKELSRTLVG